MEIIRIRQELVRCGLPQRSLNDTAIEKFFNEEFMHSTFKGEEGTKSLECVVDPFESAQTNATAKKAEEEMYLVAMKVYCDLKSGEAFKDDYMWPIIQ